MPKQLMSKNRILNGILKGLANTDAVEVTIKVDQANLLLGTEQCQQLSKTIAGAEEALVDVGNENTIARDDDVEEPGYATFNRIELLAALGYASPEVTTVDEELQVPEGLSTIDAGKAKAILAESKKKAEEAKTKATPTPAPNAPKL